MDRGHVMVLGADTHKRSHTTAAVSAATGVVLGGFGETTSETRAGRKIEAWSAEIDSFLRHCSSPLWS